MAVTLNWLLGRRKLGLSVVAGGGALDREISYVMTSELADPTPWLSPGEMILLTGLGLPAAPADLDAYVRRLVDAGVVAIGFGYGVSMDKPPAALVASAGRHRMPLIAVPLATPFLAVAREVSDRAEALRARAHEATARTQPALTRAAVTGGRPAMLAELAKACGGAAVVLDPHGRVVDSSPADVPAEALAAVSRHARTHRPGTATLGTGSGTVVVQSIRIAERTCGWLAVLTAHQLRPTDLVLVAHAHSLLTLDYLIPRRMDAAAAQVNSAALSLLITDADDLQPVRHLLAPAAGHDGRVRLLAIVGAPDSEALAAQLTDHVRADDRPVFVCSAADGTVLVLLRGDDDSAAAHALLAGLPGNVRRRLRAGLSQPSNVDRLPAATAAARTAAAACPPGGVPADAALLAGNTLLALPGAHDALRELADVYLAPLAAHDAAEGTDLVASLRAYLDCHGQWESAAAILGVHRHTLRTRIEKATALTGIDLDSARVRAELLLVLLADLGAGQAPR